VHLGTSTEYPFISTIRDVESGKKLHATPTHPLGLISVSASSSPNNSEKVVLNSVEGTVLLWDLESQTVAAKRETFNREKAEESGMHSDRVSYCFDLNSFTSSLFCLHAPIWRILRLDGERRVSSHMCYLYVAALGTVVQELITDRLAPDTFGEIQSKLVPTRAKFGMCVKHVGRSKTQ
jgi:WD40 repeat protein